MPKAAVTIFWFRRDLRLGDNRGLFEALNAGLPVVPLFIFDRDILDKLNDRADARVGFIQQEISALNDELKAVGSSMLVKHATPAEAWEELLTEYEVKNVFANHDYEPYALTRDEQLAAIFSQKGIAFHTFKDEVIFERDEVVKDDGKPYTVFTPYSRKWLQKFSNVGIKTYPSETLLDRCEQQKNREIPGLEAMGFEPSSIRIPGKEYTSVLANYGKNRDFPALPATSRIGIHLRFGTLSIRELVQTALAVTDKTWLMELIWREFYFMILWHFPHTTTQAFKPAYDRIEWRNNEAEFAAWCEGKTGYPIVDAGMRELNETGFMHNRVRMVVASFLTKHLLIDWRWGEAYFAEKLLDYELSANNGNWQWAAGSGCDAAPYFRIFNPEEQTKKFDAEEIYIRKWVKEKSKPIVEHKFARERCLDVYKKAVKE